MRSVQVVSVTFVLQSSLSHLMCTSLMTSAGLSAVLPGRENQGGTGGVGEWNGNGRVQEECV